ncbi:MAG: hypothetical protein PHE17_05310 [Thiothrix sp.]|uniref:hypothetical protein n=1 Tax=Thiothrix sp. TaxID=1032 RepID=UPI00262C4B65|nr:hypothetical protein [Thiothrix sp.]MDD5392420.1 hypothetical protein [Thiothrix sp.]
MKSNQATKAFAKNINAIHAANGLHWDTPEGKALALAIREHKGCVEAYQRERGFTGRSSAWKGWNGDVMAVLKAVPFDFAVVPSFHRQVVLDVISTRVFGRRKSA